MSNPLELVRVKDPTSGVEFSASRQYAKNAGLTVTGKDARDRHGRILPAKHDPLRQQSENAGQGVSESSTHADIDAYAAERGVDLAGASTKADKLAAIAAATENQES